MNIHYWIGDVQDSQGVSASEITYVVSGALGVKLYSLRGSKLDSTPFFTSVSRGSRVSHGVQPQPSANFYPAGKWWLLDWTFAFSDIVYFFAVSQGNQANRSVLLNSKVIDYVNFILRASEFQTCSAEKVCFWQPVCVCHGLNMRRVTRKEMPAHYQSIKQSIL